MPGNCVDACVTDPPYHLTNNTGSRSPNPGQYTPIGRPREPKGGFMGKQWDGGDVAFRPETWAEVYRVLKPGAHLLAFGGTRTYHRMACAIEDAGFEIRDCIQWLYGSGFPKSHDVSKGIDKAAGAAREVVGLKNNKGRAPGSIACIGLNTDDAGDPITAPATPEAAQWQGWGTALKPACENIILAQKPLQFGALFDTIGSGLVRLESRLWSMLPANSAEKNFGLSRSEFDAACASAQWSAEERNSIRADLCAQMGTSRFVLALTSSLSTVSSWKNTWAEALAPENTSITETELSTTIDLRTLRFLLSKITPDTIIQAHKSGLWSIANASTAVRSFDAAVSRLRTTLELSALAPAISKAVDFSRDAGVSPNLEPIVLARKPLSESTVAANVLKWGTGALNIDGCRVAASIADIEAAAVPERNNLKMFRGDGAGRSDTKYDMSSGRWPANVITDGSDEVVRAFPETRARGNVTPTKRRAADGVWAEHGSAFGIGPDGPGDTGSAARFFYCAKADADDRLKSKHPTVKPVDLMAYLARLVLPPGGTLLDPFAGSGSMGMAALRDGFNCVLIEREVEYVADINRRIDHVSGLDAPLFAGAS